MKTKMLILLLSISVVAFFGSPLICSAAEKHHGEKHHGEEAHHGEEHHEHEEEGGHDAFHHGVLSVVGKDAGHIETLVEEDMLEAWFVGHQDTDRAVQVKAEEIPLTVTVPGKGEMQLVLKAAPMRLAGEKVGQCSHFVAKADWLKDVKKFRAKGEVEFKGIRQKFFIKYPEGFNPSHGIGTWEEAQ
jgi:hypothetical protein